VFDGVAGAVAAHRGAAAAHRRARDRRDFTGMDAAAERIRAVTDYLRANRRPDLIFPLTMEWVTAGRHDAEHERYRALVDELAGVRTAADPVSRSATGAARSSGIDPSPTRSR
jgi:hypothetical protein